MKVGEQMLKRLFSGQQPYQQPYQMPNYYPDFNRFQNEINELKRINSESLKRIARLENYLGLRDQPNNY